MSNLLVAGVKEDDPAKFSNMQTITIWMSRRLWLLYKNSYDVIRI